VLIFTAFALTQTSTPSQASNSHPMQKPQHVTIKGCLANSTTEKEYQLVDEKGITNLVYSSSINLASYVGQSVTLNGDRSAVPSTDTGTSDPKPHFIAKKIHVDSKTCSSAK